VHACRPAPACPLVMPPARGLTAGLCRIVQEYDFTCLLASILCDHTSVPRALATGTTHHD
jgi:hypothetical protein